MDIGGRPCHSITQTKGKFVLVIHMYLAVLIMIHRNVTTHHDYGGVLQDHLLFFQYMHLGYTLPRGEIQFPIMLFRLTHRLSVHCLVTRLCLPTHSRCWQSSNPTHPAKSHFPAHSMSCGESRVMCRTMIWSNWRADR